MIDTRKVTFFMSKYFNTSTLIFFGVIALANQPVIGGEVVKVSSMLPSEYATQDLTITATRQAGNPAFGRYSIQISGDGSCQYLMNKQGNRTEKECASLDKEELKNILNEFYRIYFFDLKSNYSLGYNMLIRENDIIQTSLHRFIDTDSTILCFKVADYEKCVSFFKSPSHDLEDLANKILSLRPEG